MSSVTRSGKKYPMISALKQAIAIYSNDPAWAKVRPPLVELTAEQAKTLAAELEAISFTMPGIEVKGEGSARMENRGSRMERVRRVARRSACPATSR